MKEEEFKFEEMIRELLITGDIPPRVTKPRMKQLSAKWGFTTSTEIDFVEVGSELSRQNPVVMMRNIESGSNEMITLLIHYTLKDAIGNFDFSVFTLEQPSNLMEVVCFDVRFLSAAIDYLKEEKTHISKGYVDSRTYEVTSIKI